MITPDEPPIALDTDTTQDFELSDSDETLYFPVEVDFFQAGGERDFCLFTKQGDRFLLFRSPEVPLSGEDRSVLRQRGTRNLYVLESDRRHYLEYMESSMLSTLLDDSIPLEKRADTLYSAGANVVADVLSNPESKRNILRSRTIVSAMARFIDRTDDALWGLIFKDRTDPYLVTHSLNSCAFGLALGRRAGIDSEEEMEALGAGCLLKDVGQRLIPQEIVKKTTELSPSEWKDLKRHPLLGVEIVDKTNAVHEITRTVIARHHEMVDGSGYPHALSGSDVDPYARVATIVDIFDALTSDRPYSRAMSPFHSLLLMRKAYAGKIDPNVFRELVLLMKG